MNPFHHLAIVGELFHCQVGHGGYQFNPVRVVRSMDIAMPDAFFSAAA